jgi:hypothetical protein
MRTLVVALLAALYGGYWFVGQSQIETRATAALADLETKGWEVAYSDLNTTGFPSRFDTTITDLALTAPDGRFAWAAPFVQVFALSYRPNHVIAVWPPEDSLTVAGQRIDVNAQGLRASASASLSIDLPLRNVTLESGLMAVGSDAGWGFGLDRLLSAIRLAPNGGNRYDLFLEAAGLRPQTVSASIGLLRIEGEVELDRPLDRHLTEAPRLLSVTLRDARLAQGGVALAAAGGLAPDAQGYLTGTLTLRIEDWRGLLDLLEATGLLILDQAPFLALALEQLSQGGDDIEVPVTFADGQVSALGIVLAEAPRLP